MSRLREHAVLTGRLLVMLVCVSGLVGPLGEILPSLGYLVGVPIPWFTRLLIAAPVAGVLVGLGERRYWGVLAAGFLTTLGWEWLRSVALPGGARVLGSPVMIAAESLLYVAALAGAVLVVFFVDWDRVRGRLRGD